MADHDAFFSEGRQILAKLAGHRHRPCFSQCALPWILSIAFCICVRHKNIPRLNFNRILKWILVQWGRNSDYTHRTRHLMWKVYSGLVSQSFGKRILIQSEYMYSETKVSKKRTCATPGTKSHWKKTHFKCGQKNMWRRIPHRGSSTVSEERVN